MKRIGDIKTVRYIEARVIQNGYHKLLGVSGDNGDYQDMGVKDKSAVFWRRYQVKCSTFDILKGFFDIKLVYDERNGEGRVILKDGTAHALCNLSSDAKQRRAMKKALYSLRRYFTNGNGG